MRGSLRDVADADGLQVRAQHRLDGAVPAVLDVQRLDDALVVLEPRRLQPLPDVLVALAERRLLHGVERSVARLARLQRRLALVDEPGELAVLFPQFADLVGDVGERPLELGARLALAELLVGELRVLVGQRFGVGGLRGGVELFAPLFQALDARFELLGARLLDVPDLLGLVVFRRVLVPLPLPLSEGALGALERLARAAFALLRALEARLQLVQRQLQLLDLALVLVDVRGDFLRALQRLLEVGLLALAQLVRVLDGLLQARDLRARLVEARLHGVEFVRALALRDPGPLDIGLDLALTGDLRLQGGLALGQRRPHVARALVQLLQPEHQELGRRAALLVLEPAVAFRRLRLAVEVLQLLLDLFQQVHQAVEVLARVADAVGGLAPPFLVLGDAGGLLEEHPHLFRLRLDEPGDHALLDDGVAARPEARAEEDPGDVLAAAARAVQVVIGDAVAGDFPADGDLGVAGVLAL